MSKTVKNLKFEQAMKQLEKLIESLESGQMGLDESIKIFEEGMALSEHCEEKLREAEAKVEILLQSKEGPYQYRTRDNITRPEFDAEKDNPIVGSEGPSFVRYKTKPFKVVDADSSENLDSSKDLED